jgi:hypothetical protein
MRVRRTGAKRGCSPTFYIQADRPEEKAAIKAGLLDEIDRWAIGGKPYVLAYGFPNQQAVEAEMEELESEILLAVRALHILEDDGAEEAAETV